MQRVPKHQSNIFVLADDRERLRKLIDSARLDRRIVSEHLDTLEAELHRATVVEPHELPDDVVSMNSMVWFRDLQSDEVEQYELVYPHEAHVLENRISVLAPLGTALLGYRRNDTVQWHGPLGARKLKIMKVLQPEAMFREEFAGSLK